jgi:hypothetical protein
MTVLWVLFMIEYNVPHACSIQVFATELLAWGQSSRYAVDVVYPALPLVFVVTVAGGGVLLGWRGWASSDDQQDAQPAETGVARWRALAPLIMVFGVTVVVPVGALILRLASWSSVVQLWRVYGSELAESLAIAAGTGAAVVWMGTWLASDGRRPRMKHLAVAAVILLGVMPAAVVGEAFVVAYSRAPIVYDHWPVMVLTQVARWGWIGWAAGWLVNRSTPSTLVDQAHTDGAGEAAVTMTMGWRGQWPILAAAGALVGALALAEVPAMSMVRPPGVGWIAQTLMEKFHRFEDQMLVTISAVLMLAPIPATILGWLAWRTWRSQ